MQGGSTGVGYGLKYQARCIADVKADTDHTSFLTGTLSLKEENEVHLIRLSSDGTELVCEGLFSHPNEIWDLASCPFDQRIFSTVFSSGESYEAAVWQIPELYGQSNSPQLERIASLDGHASKIKRVLWWPSGRHDKLISLDEQNIFLWSLDSSKKSAQVQAQESAGMLHHLSGGAWDPHDVNAVASASESSIQFWDLRTMKKTTSIEYSHVRDMDFDSKKQHMLVTAADESGINIWDLRMLKPLLQSLLNMHTGHGLLEAILNLKGSFLYSPFLFCILLLLNITHIYICITYICMYTMMHTQAYMYFIWVIFADGIHVQSAGTDSAINLWFAIPPSNDELTPDSMSNLVLEGQSPCSIHTVTMRTVFMAFHGVLESLGYLHHYLMMEG